MADGIVSMGEGAYEVLSVDAMRRLGYELGRLLADGDVVVTIIGRDGDDEITLDDMAEMRGTISYEVACDFGMRLEKVYV